MSEMVERVAKAQWNLDIEFGSRPCWDNASPEQRSAAMDMARAAIEAMREPTEAMRDVGNEAAYQRERISGLRTDRMAPETWQAMIDAALE